jgi:copper chaperone CopZ
MAKAILKVTGMTCEHCRNAVRRALTGVAGVVGAEVDLAAGRAEVTLSSDTVPAAELIAAVEEEGYGAELLA